MAYARPRCTPFPTGGFVKLENSFWKPEGPKALNARDGRSHLTSSATTGRWVAVNTTDPTGSAV